MIAYQEVADLADQLTLAEILQLIEHLGTSLRQMLESEAYKRMDWHDFLHATYGSLRDNPIQRWKQGEYEEREPLE